MVVEEFEVDKLVLTEHKRQQSVKSDIVSASLMKVKMLMEYLDKMEKELDTLERSLV